MQNHTLILSTAKLQIPESFTIDLVTGLMNRDITKVEYFGQEIDNPVTYIDDEMISDSSQTTFIEMYFDTDYSIDYEKLTESEVIEFILDIIKKSADIEMRADHKDITVYL